MGDLLSLYSEGDGMSCPAARAARRCESVRLSSTMVMSTLVDCICGVWNLRSLSSASTRVAGSRAAMSMSYCEMRRPVGFPPSSVSGMRGVKYSTECCRRNVLRGFSLLGVPGCLPPRRPRPSPFVLGITQNLKLLCEVMSLTSCSTNKFCEIKFLRIWDY